MVHHLPWFLGLAPILQLKAEMPLMLTKLHSDISWCMEVQGTSYGPGTGGGHCRCASARSLQSEALSCGLLHIGCKETVHDLAAGGKSLVTVCMTASLGSVRRASVRLQVAHSKLLS